MPDARPLVLGVGTRHRRDDAVGLEVVTRVAARVGEQARTVPCEGDGTTLLDRWAGEPFVVLVDALAPRGRPGRVERLEGDFEARLADPPPTSTHGLSVGEAWRLGRSLGMLPGRLVVYGVEGVDFTPGFGLSELVARVVDPVVDAVVAELTGGPRTVVARA